MAIVAVAGCTQSPTNSPRPAALKSADFQGVWLLTLTPDSKSGARMRTVPEDGAPAQNLKRQDFRLEVTARGDEISGCILDPSFQTDQCSLDGDRFKIEIADGSGPALLMTFDTKTDDGFSGFSAIRAPMLPLPKRVGVVSMKRVD